MVPIERVLSYESHSEASLSLPGCPMIREVEIEHYKCFQRLSIVGCKPINIILGDNGVGKTALLEATFLALGSTSELAARYRQNRGLEGSFSGQLKRIEEAIFRDLFFDRDWRKPLTVRISGEGQESRGVSIFKGSTNLTMELGGDEEQLAGGINVVWTSASGAQHHVQPTINARSIDFPSTDEDLPNFLFFSSANTPTSLENAARFSMLSRAKRDEDFVKIFTLAYDWIEDMRVEVEAGQPIVYATVRGLKDRLPLANVSGGVNRIAGIMLGIAFAQNAIVLVDEIENGIFYAHHESVWRGLLALARNYQTQLFMTTHSEEWVRALFAATGEQNQDIAIWRLERDENNRPVLHQFEGRQIINAIKHGADIRGV